MLCKRFESSPDRKSDGREVGFISQRPANGANPLTIKLAGESLPRGSPSSTARLRSALEKSGCIIFSVPGEMCRRTFLTYIYKGSLHDMWLRKDFCSSPVQG